MGKQIVPMDLWLVVGERRGEKRVLSVEGTESGATAIQNKSMGDGILHIRSLPHKDFDQIMSAGKQLGDVVRRLIKDRNNGLDFVTTKDLAMTIAAWDEALGNQ